MSVALAMLVLATTGTLPAAGPLYDTTPLIRSAPVVAKAHTVAHQKNASEAQLGAAHDTLAKWLARPARDAHARDVALWVDGTLLARLGRIDDARGRLAELTHRRSTLAQPLRARLGRRKQATKADLATWLETSPHADQAHVTCKTAAERLAAMGSPDVAADALQRVLLEPMTSWRRGRLMRLRAAMLQAAGDTDEARRQTARAWWRSGRLREAPSVLAHWARRALLTDGSRRVAELRQALGKLDDSVMPRDLRTLLDAVLQSDDRSEREAAYKRVAALPATVYEGPGAVFAWFGTAIVRRRVDRDLAAAAAYRAVFAASPHHPLADEARREAAWLLKRRGVPADARALYRELAQSPRWGGPNRDGLWQDGLAALTEGRHAEAILRFEALAARYGGQREGYGLPWAARATYWRARALQEAGRNEEARLGFVQVQTAFPLSWYAMLAREQLASMAVAGAIDRFVDVGPVLAANGRYRGAGADSLKVARRPELDLAMAYYRLGALARSKAAFEALDKARLLYDSGRTVWADIEARRGNKEAAERLTIGRGTWARAPGRKDKRAFRNTYPMPYRKRIKRLARAHGYAPGFLAGLIHVESRFKPRVRSGAGAVGLTQLMYRTAKSVAKHLLKRRIKKRDLYRPKTNLRIGSTFLRELYEHFGRNPALAAAAYNAGHGAVRGWLKRRGHLPTDLFVELIPYDQTRNYVRRVVSMSEMFRRLYGLPGGTLDVPLDLPLTLGPFFEEKD